MTMRGTSYVCALVALALPRLTLALPGDGIKVGDGRFHPGGQVETHYVLNPGYRRDDIGDVYLVGRLGGELEFPSERLDLKVDGGIERRQFLGLENRDTRKLSTFAGGLSTKLHINKGKGTAVRVQGNVTRFADAANQSISGRLLHLTGTAGVGLDYTPGGGALVFSVDYNVYYDRYDRDQGIGTGGCKNPTLAGCFNPTVLDNLRHLPKIRSTWKFLPKTAWFVEVEGAITRYPGGGEFAGGGKNAPVNLLLAQGGLVGNVTNKITVLAKAGYGNTFLSTPDNFQSAVGQLEGTYTFSETMKAKAGMVRTVQPVSLFKYFDIWRAYARYDHLLFGKTELSLQLQYDYLLFGQPVAGAPEQRKDGDLLGLFSIEHHFRDWFVVSLIERVDLRKSNYVSATNGQVSYVHNDVFLKAGMKY